MGHLKYGEIEMLINLFFGLFMIGSINMLFVGIERIEDTFYVSLPIAQASSMLSLPLYPSLHNFSIHNSMRDCL